MNKLRPMCVFAAAAVAGGITPWLLPSEWFSHVLGACLVGLLLFGALAASSAEPKEPDQLGLVWWFVLGTDRPKGNVNDPQALMLFFLVLTYLVGFTVGAFGVVHA